MHFISYGKSHKIIIKEKKGATEDEMIGWHHRLSGHEFEQILGDGDGLKRKEVFRRLLATPG